jgi:hypothetical protein
VWLRKQLELPEKTLIDSLEVRREKNKAISSFKFRVIGETNSMEAWLDSLNNSHGKSGLCLLMSHGLVLSFDA